MTDWEKLELFLFRLAANLTMYSADPRNAMMYQTEIIFRELGRLITKTLRGE